MISGAGNLVLNDSNTRYNLAITIMCATCEFEITTSLPRSAIKTDKFNNVLIMHVREEGALF